MIRTRIAPSPTGQLHIGSLYIALKNYAYAKGRQGQFIIRIEDTDRQRLVPGAIEQTLATLKAYGLSWDEGPDVGGPYGPYIQSARLPIYQKHAQKLVDSHHAYYCFCSKDRLESMRQDQLTHKQLPRYDRHCRSLSQAEIQSQLAQKNPFVIRLKVPDHQTIEVNDLIRGPISFQTDLIDDQVLIKSDGYPTYHLGVVVDDYLMKITHIIRGEEWISSTPKHLLLYQAFGWPLPVYAHAPDLLSPTGKGKMSKRHGDVSAQSFLDKGYLPEAVLNFLMVLGWASFDQEEILSLDRYLKEFDVRDINKKSVAFDIQKLDYFNGYYLRQMSLSQLEKRLQPFKPEALSDALFRAFIPLIQDRLVRLADFAQLSLYLYQDPKPPVTVILKECKLPAPAVVTYFRKVISLLPSITWKPDQIETKLRQLQLQLNLHPRAAFMSLRLAICGVPATPPLFDLLSLLDRSLVQTRLNTAIKALSS